MSTYVGAPNFTRYNLEQMELQRLQSLSVLEAYPEKPHIELADMPLPIGGFPEGYEQVGEFHFKETSTSQQASVRLWRPK
jgi:hypothetical protein